jgi:hypothetical protein
MTAPKRRPPHPLQYMSPEEIASDFTDERTKPAERRECEGAGGAGDEATADNIRRRHNNPGENNMTTTNAFDARDLYDIYRVTIRMRERLCGGTPTTSRRN